MSEFLIILIVSLLLEFDSLLHWSAKHLDNLEYNPKIIDVNETIDEILSLSSFQSNLKKYLN